MSSGRTLITVGESNRENPCRYCTTEQGRTWDCHGRCDRYTAWNNGHKADREARKEQQREEADFVQYQKNILPAYKRKNKRD